jgi:hypothetical protein
MDPVNRGLAAIAAAAEDVNADLAASRDAANAATAAAHAVAAARAEGTREGASSAATGERARIAAIVNAPEAKGREGLANHLAFNTELAPAAAIEMLKVAPIAAPERVSRLDGKVPAPQIDAIESGQGGRDATAGLRAAVIRQIEKLGKKPLTAH